MGKKILLNQLCHLLGVTDALVSAHRNIHSFTPPPKRRRGQRSRLKSINVSSVKGYKVWRNVRKLRKVEVRSMVRARSHSLLCAEDAACYRCRSALRGTVDQNTTSSRTPRSPPPLDSSPKRLRTSSYGTPSASASSSARRSISLVECHLLASSFIAWARARQPSFVDFAGIYSSTGGRARTDTVLSHHRILSPRSQCPDASYRIAGRGLDKGENWPP